MPGLIDMPAANGFPDGEIIGTVSTFAGLTRFTLSFQIAPRITGAFRYNRFDDLNIGGFVDYYDRAFDVHYLVFEETDRLPAIAVGLRDFAGTGIEAAEYVVASKTYDLPSSLNGGRLTVSGGLGWGRLGSFNSLGSPFSDDRPSFAPGDTGGEFSFDQWFRGPMAAFAGAEWAPNDRLRIKVEYSSDEYELETQDRDLFDRASPLNFGAEWQANNSVRLGFYARYGSEVGAMLHFSGNPRRSVRALRLPSPGPLARRPDRAEAPESWSTSWRDAPDVEGSLAARLSNALSDEDILVTGLTLDGAQRATLRVENAVYTRPGLIIGRSARAMAATLPASVEIFTILLEDGGLPVSQITIRRTDLEALETAPDREEALASLASVTGPPPSGSLTGGVGGSNTPNLYPRAFLQLRPYLATSVFDPDDPIRADVGLALTGRLEPVRGLVFDGQLRQPFLGNLDEARISGSALEQVRTNAPLYDQADGVRLSRLTASYSAKLGG
ncbi:MAG: YjbH domain-containing protein, partial [Pseudomonadota bacterium]